MGATRAATPTRGLSAAKVSTPGPTGARTPTAAKEPQPTSRPTRPIDPTRPATETAVTDATFRSLTSCSRPTPSTRPSRVTESSRGNPTTGHRCGRWTRPCRPPSPAGGAAGPRGPGLAPTGRRRPHRGVVPTRGGRCVAAVQGRHRRTKATLRPDRVDGRRRRRPLVGTSARRSRSSRRRRAGHERSGRDDSTSATIPAIGRRTHREVVPLRRCGRRPNPTFARAVSAVVSAPSRPCSARALHRA